MDEYTKLAQNSIETYVETGKTMEIPKNLPENFYNVQKGVFVTIYRKDSLKAERNLRGCIGTFMPTKENIALEIIDNAISAAIYDYRFAPVTESELKNLQYEVRLLNPPEWVDSMGKLDAKKYGVIVKSLDGRTGLLLPDIEEINTPRHQILIACQKAGIDPKCEKIELYRFTVEKHKNE